MLDYQTLILRINEMHQALATIPVANLNAAIAAAADGRPLPHIVAARPTDTVGIVVSALARSSHYEDRSLVYPTLVTLRALHDNAQDQHVQWASELTPWKASFPEDCHDILIPYYSHLSIYGLVGIIANESRDEPDREHLSWLHRTLMHICIFAYLRGIDLISEIRATFDAAIEK